MLFESKSYPLFSLLFGMGLVLMYDRAKAAGRPFAGTIVLAIYGLQLVISPLWLARFLMGPLEHFWRCGTYLKVTPLLRAKANGSKR